MKSGLWAVMEAVRRVQVAELEKKVATMGDVVAKRISLSKENAEITTKEAAALLRVHPKTVERWVRTKGLPCKHRGRNLVFVRGDVLRWQAHTES